MSGTDNDDPPARPAEHDGEDLLALSGAVLSQEPVSIAVAVAKPIAKKILGPSPNELLESAERDADRDAARRVPALARRLDAAEQRLATVLQFVRDEAEVRAGDRGRELLRVADSAGIPIEEVVATPAGARAVGAAWRAMIATEADEVVPLLAALALRFRERDGDQLFRALVRVLVDASAQEVVALRVLVEAALEARVWAQARAMTWDGSLTLRVDKVSSYPRPREGVTWINQWHQRPALRVADEPIPSRRGIVATLLRHGVFVEPREVGPSQEGRDRACAEIESDTLDVLRDLLDLQEPPPPPPPPPSARGGGTGEGSEAEEFGKLI